jgi:signal transduction histidine kinase
MLSTFTILSLLAYNTINVVLEKNLVNRKTPDSILLRKVFTSPVPADIDDEDAKMATMRSGISGAHRNTLIQVYDYKPDGGVVPLVNNEFDVPGKIPFEVQKIATDMLLTAVSEANVDAIRKGKRFTHKGVDYHLISQEFPLDRMGRMGEVILLTNIDSSLKETRDKFITAWGLFALTINVAPVAKLTRQVRAGQSAKPAWWAPQSIEDLASQLNLDKAANDQYRNEVALERKMVEIAPVMLVRCKLPKLGKQAIFTYVNPAVKDQLGWPVLIGQPLNTIVPPLYGGYHTWLGLYDENLKRDVGMASCPLHNHKSRVVEAVRPVQAITAIGEVIDVLLSVQLLDPDEDGSLNFAGTMIDVSPLVKAREAEAEARKVAEDATTSLTKNLVMWRHDLMTAVKGSYDSLRRMELSGFEPPESHANAWNLSVKKAKNTYDLLEQTREALTVDLKSSLKISPVPLKTIWEDIQFDFTQYNVLTPDDAADISIAVDYQQFKRALYNLINNGIRYSHPPNELINISIQIKGSQCVFLVEDNGIGIAPEDQGRILTGAMGVEARLRSDIDGNGLGLESARRIAEAHGGKCKLLQSALDHGSIFAISFLVAK